MIKIVNLQKSFGDKAIFKNLNLEFDTGVYAIMGESGVGKTTLLRIISSLDKDYKGSVEVDGDISYAFQEHRLFPLLTALENVTFKRTGLINKATSLLSQMNFSSDDFGRKIDELSGGMKQRVSLARAILAKSDILLLDEPTKELDDNTARAVLDIIKSEAKDRIVIIVTHNLADAEYLGANIIQI